MADEKDVKALSALLDLNCKQMDANEEHPRFKAVKQQVEQIGLKAHVSCSNKIGDNPAVLFLDYNSDPQIRRLRGLSAPTAQAGDALPSSVAQVKLNSEIETRMRQLDNAFAIFIAKPAGVAVVDKAPAPQDTEAGWLTRTINAVFGGNPPPKPQTMKLPSLANVVRENNPALDHTMLGYHTPIIIRDIAARPEPSAER